MIRQGGARRLPLMQGYPTTYRLRSSSTGHIPRNPAPESEHGKTNYKNERSLFSTFITRITRPYSARSVKTIDPEIREILIFTLWPGFAFATYMM
jgi:hypothetical protein